MQLFSEYLRDLLKARKLTVSALSRLSGVERTALSKTLTGQRVLPYAVLDDLIYHLRLTPGEEQRLRGYYDAQFEKERLRQSVSFPVISIFCRLYFLSCGQDVPFLS